jgi:hypothetical protein
MVEEGCRLFCRDPGVEHGRTAAFGERLAAWPATQEPDGFSP